LIQPARRKYMYAPCARMGRQWLFSLFSP
jgi:hypothetical protein